MGEDNNFDIMIKNLILIAFIAVVMISCDTTEDIFENSNMIPVLTLKGGSHSDYGRHKYDSVKLENIFYDLDYRIIDEENIHLIIDIDSIFRYEVKDNRITIGTEKIGSSNIYLSVKDSWGKEDTITFNLTCFENKAPIAHLEIVKLNKEREYTLNASLSYDQDAKHGGEVILYRFYVNGKEIEKRFVDSISYTFPKEGEYKVGVQVKDNNEVWSPIVTQTINI